MHTGIDNVESRNMRVSVEQSGGFAGISRSSVVDAAELSPEQADRLRQLVEATKFFALPERVAGPVHPDQFEYQIMVEEGGRAHRVTVSESGLSDEIRSLVDWVRSTASQQ